MGISTLWELIEAHQQLEKESIIPSVILQTHYKIHYLYKKQAGVQGTLN